MGNGILGIIIRIDKNRLVDISLFESTIGFVVEVLLEGETMEDYNQGVLDWIILKLFRVWFKLFKIFVFATPPILALSSVVEQIYKWAKYGRWENISFGETLSYFEINYAFVYYEKNWVGLCKVAGWILESPAYIMWFVISAIILAMAVLINLLDIK